MKNPKTKYKKRDRSYGVEEKLGLIVSLLKDLLVLKLRERGKLKNEIGKIVKMDSKRISQLIKESPGKKESKKKK